ncbi:MAG: exodeoxyribonuclease I [Gammaproteobacteria bacterium]|nr:exodeoxyribonuclease I [Gammaproteobacteria bacterium]
MQGDSASFFWYDLETSGTVSRWDRIVQFAGIRTDHELNETGESYSAYIHLPDDVLPNPDSVLVTGITPQLTHAEGIGEWQAMTRINELFSAPQTCVVGYNSLRFDDEFMRYGLYRMLIDPYAREWQNGNSRWDIIDLVRATGALRRDGITWPVDEEGLPVYRLEALTRANGLEHGHAHDATSDVRATISLARLIKTQQPKLFDYYFRSRFKKQVKALLEPYGSRLCVHVSGMYPRARFGVAPIMSLCRHPTNSNSVIVADLGQDIESLVQWPEQRIREELFKAGNAERPPLKEIRINRCPFVAGIEVLNRENWSRLALDRGEIEERQRRLMKPGIAQKIRQVFSQRKQSPAEDVEGALYEAFLKDEDRARCQSLQRALGEGSWLELDYTDKRLRTLAMRLKARGFTERLSASERADWNEFVSRKLRADDAPWFGLARFQNRVEDLLIEAREAGRDLTVLHQLADHGRLMAETYPE